jgi:hypothetical protein
MASRTVELGKPAAQAHLLRLRGEKLNSTAGGRRRGKTKWWGNGDIDLQPLQPHWPAADLCVPSADVTDQGEGQALFCPSFAEPRTKGTPRLGILLQQ